MLKEGTKHIHYCDRCETSLDDRQANQLHIIDTKKETYHLCSTCRDAWYDTLEDFIEDRYITLANTERTPTVRFPLKFRNHAYLNIRYDRYKEDTILVQATEGGVTIQPVANNTLMIKVGRE